MPFRFAFRIRLALTFCLVAALLWAPSWGQWHGIVHPAQPSVSVSDLAKTLTDSVAQRAKAHEHGHEQGSALCQVLDHLGHASALAAWAVSIPLVHGPLVVPAAHWRDGQEQHLWRPAQARAPPHRI